MRDAVSDAVANLLVAGAALHAKLDAIYAQFGLTSSAADILRILRADPEGCPRGLIAQRMVSRAPDVTRLIDRLQRQGLVRRVRHRSDRRLSVTRITPRGLDLIARIEPAIEQYRMHIAPSLSAAEWDELSRLCERVSGGRKR